MLVEPQKQSFEFFQSIYYTGGVERKESGKGFGPLDNSAQSCQRECQELAPRVAQSIATLAESSGRESSYSGRSILAERVSTGEDAQFDAIMGGVPHRDGRGQ